MPRRPSIPNQVQEVHVNVHLSQKLCDELTAKYPTVEAKSARVRQAVVDSLQQSINTGPNYAAIFKDSYEILDKRYTLSKDTEDATFAIIASGMVKAGINVTDNPVVPKYSDKLERTLAEFRELVNLKGSDEDVLIRLLETSIMQMKNARTVVEEEPDFTPDEE